MEKITHIYLVGPRACGKSTVAKVLGKRTGSEVIDGDEITNNILEAEGHGSIGEITKSGSAEGWQIMRAAESEGVELICDRYSVDNLIWAPGGGVVAHGHNEELRTRNVRNLKEWGIGVYLLPDHDDTGYSSWELAHRIHSDNLKMERTGDKSNFRNPIKVKTGCHPLQIQLLDTQKMLELRHHHYKESARHCVSTKKLNPEQIADKILELL